MTLPHIDPNLWLSALLAAVPAALVLEHLLYLWLIKSRQIGEKSDFPGESRNAKVFLAPTRDDSYRRWNRAFSYRGLYPAYAFASGFTFFVTLVGFAVFTGRPILWLSMGPSPDAASEPAASQPADELRVVLGQVFGLAGAYVYTLTILARRSLRRDITKGIALWCGATLALGPMVGNLASRFFDNAAAKDPSISFVAVCFIAGFSPRSFVDALRGIAERFLTKAGAAAQASPRVIPLTSVRGIDLEVADRLSEEGIIDATSLAFAEPLYLLANTPFRLPQILNWIDEAMLIVTLPESWQQLERAGITGAIDLAWYHGHGEDNGNGANGGGGENAGGGGGAGENVGAGGAPVAPAQNGGGGGSANGVAWLAKAASIDETVLKNVVARLFEDAQVQSIWALYQSVDTNH